MSLSKIRVVTIGCVNTAIAAIGLEHLASAGELSYGGSINIGPGGKSANMAQMIAELIGPNKVGMVSKTSRDPLNLWRVPVDALMRHGVNTEYLQQLPFEETNKYPCIALIAVDQKGAPQIYVVPGINDDFLPADIQAAKPLFEAAKENDGFVVLSLELPVATALESVKQAHAKGLKVMLDPGGMLKGADYNELLQQKVHLIKPNEHEATMLTGIPVKSAGNALQAAHRLRSFGIANVLITLGEQGALLVNENTEVLIEIPKIAPGPIRDQTGCGDQSMAALSAALIEGHTITIAAQLAVLAGTLEFYKEGVVPVTKAELEKAGHFESIASVT
jgi:ribokinase